MDTAWLLENLRELCIIAAGVLFAEGVKYLGDKVYRKIDARFNTFLD